MIIEIPVAIDDDGTKWVIDLCRWEYGTYKRGHPEVRFYDWTQR